MSTSSPGGTESFFHPRRNSELGAPSSKRQFVTFPSGSFTSTYNHECGLTHSIFVTVPCTLNCLLTSNSAANEWCAATGTADRSRAITAITGAASEENVSDISNQTSLS